MPEFFLAVLHLRYYLSGANFVFVSKEERVAACTAIVAIKHTPDGHAEIINSGRPEFFFALMKLLTSVS